MPGRIGLVFHTTFSCAAAWIASNSFGATTPRKLPTCTTFAPGMWAIDFASTLIGTFELYGYGALAARPHHAAVQHPGHPTWCT